MTSDKKIISFQGIKGSYHEQACHEAYPNAEALPCHSFAECFESVQTGRADMTLIAIDNTIAGRVADVHRLIPESSLYIVGEHFLPIRHCLLGIPGTKLEDITSVHSHVHALPQCHNFIKKHHLESVVEADTAGAAAMIAEVKNPARAAIASELAAGIYGLEVIKHSIQDSEKNVTRFIIMAKEPQTPQINEQKIITTLVFEVRNIPAALYKALGGFATNGVNMTKLESYIVDEKFTAARFYCDVEGHPDESSMKQTLEELGFFAKHVHILGTYPAHPFRNEDR